MIGALALTVLGAASLAPSSPPALMATPVSPVLSATVAPAELVYGGALTVTGAFDAAGTAMPVASVELQANPYPFRGYVTIARQRTGADGSYSFAGVRPDRNVRLRVLLEGASVTGTPQAPAVSSRQLSVIVDPSVAMNARRLRAGETRLSVRIRHTSLGGAAPVSVGWFVAANGTRDFRLAAVTSSRELASGLTYASATVDPPSKRFLYRVCLSPAWARAMGQPASHRPCPDGDFAAHGDTSALELQGEGSGTPVPAFPSSAAIASATRYLDARAGRTSFAVVDSTGELSGVRLHAHFQTASVVKVMMLVAYLQMLSARHRGLDANDTSLLYPMIHVSDNEAASAVLARVGGAALARVARESGMTDYAPGVGWWAYTQTSAADQARFFFALPRLIPPQFYAYARGLLAGIEPSQSWGVPPVARPRWQVFFKTGALPEEGLFNEVARLERPGLTFTVAVFTDGDPSMSYGEQTIEGVAATLLSAR